MTKAREIAELGQKLTVDASGNMEFAGDLELGDNNKAIFGAGSDLQIYHDGSNSFISDQGTGNLRILAQDFRVVNSANSETMIQANVDADVRLYYDSAPKLATSSTGISITGDATFADNGKAIFGAGSDLQIYHDGSHSYVQDAGTGNLYLRSDTFLALQNSAGNANYLFATNGGAVQLFHNNSTKLSTTSTGVDITGTLTSDGLTVDGNPVINGTSPQLFLQTSSASHYNWQIAAQENVAGAFEISSGNTDSSAPDDTYTKRLLVNNNGDISFYEDTGTTAKFFWDASAESLQIGSSGTATPAANLIINDTAASGFKAKLTSSAFNVDGNWLGLGMGYYSGYMKSAIIAEAKDGNARANLHFALDSDTGSSNVGLADSKMTITYDGNVGIGTDSPSDVLHVSGGSSTDGILIQNPLSGSLYNAKLEFTRDGTSGGAKIQTERNAAGGVGLSFNYTSSNANEVSGTYSEAMRINSSGNLLVGTTDTTVYDNNTGTTADNGLNLRGDGKLDAARYNGIVLGLNLTGNDGTIAEFRKGGSPVGSIGAAAGPVAYIVLNETTSDNVSALKGAGGAILPSTNAGADKDGTMNLGSSAARFESLYLSNGIVGNSNNITISTDGGTTDHVTVDTSGNFLVGTTSADNGDAGFEARSDGRIFSTTTLNSSFNRLSSDGAIIAFQKNTVDVGIIGTKSGEMYLGSANTGIRFYDAGDALTPFNASGTQGRDNAIDIGVNTARFKDLYLSGGVHLGGTGSANKLDDYEEGTWTAGFTGATVSATNTTGYYTKIGRVVHYNYYSGASNISSASGTAELTGLPFTVKSGTEAYQPFYTSHNTFFGGSTTTGVEGYVNINQNSLRFTASGGTSNVTLVNSGSAYIMVAGFYVTDS